MNLFNHTESDWAEEAIHNRDRAWQRRKFWEWAWTNPTQFADATIIKIQFDAAMLTHETWVEALKFAGEL